MQQEESRFQLRRNFIPSLNLLVNKINAEVEYSNKLLELEQIDKNNPCKVVHKEVE